MSILDKFLSIMKLDDEEEYLDDFMDDEDDFIDDDEPKKNFLNKFKKPEKEEVYNEPKASTKPVNKVTPMRSAKRGAAMEVCVIKPSVVDEAREITETLLSGRTVILNLEGLDLEIAQRIIDFTSGATFAIDGNLQKISTYIFLVTPANVDISGDLQDLLNTSFDVPSIKLRY